MEATLSVTIEEYFRDTYVMFKCKVPIVSCDLICGLYHVLEQSMINYTSEFLWGEDRDVAGRVQVLTITIVCCKWLSM